MGSRRNTGRLGPFLLQALVIGVLMAPAPAWAVLRIGSTSNQNHLTEQRQANAIADYLKDTSGYAIDLAKDDNGGRPFWTVTLGAPVQGVNKPIGHALVSAMIASPKTITIAIGAGGDVGVTSCAEGFVKKSPPPPACKEATGSVGAGMDAIVELTSTTPSDKKDRDTPRYIIVAHEFIHALHATMGRRLLGTPPNEARTIGPYLGYTGQQQPPLIPGFQFTENALRGENTYTPNRGNPTPLRCREPFGGTGFVDVPGGQPHC